MTEIHEEIMDRAVDAELDEPLEHTAQKVSELGFAHFARGHSEFGMIARGDMALDGHIERRVGNDHLGQLGSEQFGVGTSLQGVAADHTVVADGPQIAQPADRGRGAIDVGKWWFDLSRIPQILVTDEEIDLTGIEAGQRQVEIDIAGEQVCQLELEIIGGEAAEIMKLVVGQREQPGVPRRAVPCRVSGGPRRIGRKSRDHLRRARPRCDRPRCPAWLRG